MKLLMITQKIDRDDDILGVYHEWAREISKSFDKLSVICLYKGRNELPRGIEVFSLGKEINNFQFSINFQSIFNFKIFKKPKYIWLFYRYIWQERRNYDAVFVHMNPVYVLMGWPMWKILNKKICLWFAHPAWNRQVKLAYILSDKVITSVPEAFRKRGGKVHAIGQGIDTELFENTGFGDGTKSSILSLGRISPSKNIHILIEALRGLKESGVLFTFTLVGSAPQMPGAAEYDRKIKDMIMDFDMADASELHSAVPYGETVNWYNKNEVFVNLSPTGHFDKTVLEAMASGCITLASNDAYYNIFPQDLHGLLIFKQGDADDLAQKLKKVLELPEDKKDEIRERLRDVVVKNHSIYTLGERVSSIVS